MSDEELVSKFRSNASEILDKGQQDRVVELTWHFEDIEDVGEYLSLLR
jgi:hypothetical protein